MENTRCKGRGAAAFIRMCRGREIHRLFKVCNPTSFLFLFFKRKPFSLLSLLGINECTDQNSLAMHKSYFTFCPRKKTQFYVTTGGREKERKPVHRACLVCWEVNKNLSLHRSVHIHREHQAEPLSIIIIRQEEISNKGLSTNLGCWEVQGRQPVRQASGGPILFQTEQFFLSLRMQLSCLQIDLALRQKCHKTPSKEVFCFVYSFILCLQGRLDSQASPCSFHSKISGMFCHCLLPRAEGE